MRELFVAALRESCHEAMNVLSAGPDVAAAARRARLRRASRMLVTEELAWDDVGSLPVTGANRARHALPLIDTHGL